MIIGKSVSRGKLCQVRNATLQAALAVLVENGRVLKDRAGYALAR